MQAGEAQLLKSRGHGVLSYKRHNDELQERGALGAIGAGVETVWAERSFRELKELIAKESPDVAHFHNIFPLISPAAYYACEQAGVPVVQTLHNYRLLCPSATLLRDGKVCEACLGRSVPWPGIVHRCYRGSRPATVAVSAMLAVHRAMRTWKEKVSVYIALSGFARGKFVEGGLPEDRIVVKPNFVSGDFKPKRAPGEYALFVGRLSEEKGPQWLLSAWRMMQARVPLRIVGDGPLLEKLAREVKDSSLAHIELIGRKAPEEVRSLMLDARFLLSPSICHENFPIVIAEAFACGLPVIASRLGSMAEIVHDGVTGLHFEAGNAADLASKVEWAWNHPDELERMSRAARVEYEAKYTPARNYEMLMEIYHRAMAQGVRAAVQAGGVPVPPNFMPSVLQRQSDRSVVPAPEFRILGVRVDALQIPEAIGKMEEWISRRDECRYVAVTGMHGVTEAQHDSSFKNILNSAALVVPDGMPLVWLGRRKGFALRRRVYGPELMAAFCAQTAAKGYRHFFYGGAPGVAEDLSHRFTEQFPGLRVAGTYCPPFRPLSREEETAVVATINRPGADIVWVGLSTPKQERWMFEHRKSLTAPVLVGVGAAFDFHTGRVSQAPYWMREHGLEWLFRLCHEPRRLWRRYLLYGAEFTALVLLEALRLKKFP